MPKSKVMRTTKLLYAALVLTLMTGACKQAPVSNILTRTTPEAEGVSSQGILDFLDAAAKSQNEFHSLVFLRHGKIVAEGWWDPYQADLKHTLYSASKSFTATAVGFAVTEKKLTVNDKVVSFFPDDLPDTVSPFLAGMTVKDLLTMTAGQDPDPTFSVIMSDSNWVRSFLSLPIVNKPGTKFLYNTLATYMLSAIVQKVTGEKLIDYLTPRLFQPLGIEGMDWETDPREINTGGWGLRLKTEDMARFGQLFLQKGKWNGKQILPASWIEEATTAWIDQAPDAPQAKKDSSDWMQGYCYQMWRCRNNGFRADGAYGQYIIVLPAQDAVIAITSETRNMQDELNLVWQYLLPAMQKGKLPDNDQLTASLTLKLSSLAIAPPEKGTDSPMATEISEKIFTMDPNEKGIESISFLFMTDMCHVSLKKDSTDYQLAFGAGKWLIDETAKRGPNLVSSEKVSFTRMDKVKVAGSFRWQDRNTLELVIRYIESPHTETMICKFDGKKLELNDLTSNNPGTNAPVLKGKIKN
jgi:CubicO group peptidase (beta-lactamase class C family)